jgi:hypothetical protein
MKTMMVVMGTMTTMTVTTINENDGIGGLTGSTSNKCGEPRQQQSMMAGDRTHLIQGSMRLAREEDRLWGQW